jgi:hypothetical protein
VDTFVDISIIKDLSELGPDPPSHGLCWHAQCYQQQNAIAEGSLHRIVGLVLAFL